LVTGDEMFRSTLDELSRLLCASSILGQPIEAGNKVVIPVAEFAFGFGAGSGAAGTDKPGGSGTGAGGNVSAVALAVVMTDVSGAEGIQVLSLKTKSPASEVVAQFGERILPLVVEAVKGKEFEISPEGKKVDIKEKEG
jgi:uncharacterized spore protein YtfJ